MEKPLAQLRTGSGGDLGFFVEGFFDIEMILTPLLYWFYKGGERSLDFARDEEGEFEIDLTSRLYYFY